MPQLNLRDAVQGYLNIASFREKWDNDQRIGAGYFYALTYPTIFSIFQQYKGLHEALDLKIALIFSWNPTICKVSYEKFHQAKSELVSLENIARNLDETNLLNTDVDEMVSTFWPPIKKATSVKDSNTGVSVTKFLHFSFPHICPMIDLNMMKSIGGKAVSAKWYSVFLSDWKDLYKQAKPEFDQISRAVDMPVTRVLDIMLFTPR